MTDTIPPALLQAYSRGEITRKEIEEEIGEALSFGALLRLLHDYDLPLPRIPADPANVALVRSLFEAKRHVR